MKIFHSLVYFFIRSQSHTSLMCSLKLQFLIDFRFSKNWFLTQGVFAKLNRAMNFTYSICRSDYSNKSCQIACLESLPFQIIIIVRKSPKCYKDRYMQQEYFTITGYGVSRSEEQNQMHHITNAGGRKIFQLHRKWCLFHTTGS